MYEIPGRISNGKVVVDILIKSCYRHIGKTEKRKNGKTEKRKNGKTEKRKNGKTEIRKDYVMTRTIQIRKKGTLTLPMELRKRYHLEEGDPVTLVDLDEGIFISPKRSVLPKLAAQIEQLCSKNNISLAELIEGVRTLRKQKS